MTGTYNNEIDIVRCTVKLCTMSGNLLIVFVCLQCTLETTPIRLMITDTLASNIK